MTRLKASPDSDSHIVPACITCARLWVDPGHSSSVSSSTAAFSKLKALLRNAGARTREALMEAMGRALDAVTADDARGFFEHRGYRPMAQLL